MRTTQSLKSTACAATLLLLLLSVRPAAATDVLSLIPQDAKVVLRLDWATLKDDPTMMALIERFPQGYNSASSITETAGFRLDTVRAVWVIAKELNRAVVVVEGTFPIDEIRNRLTLVEGVQQVAREGYDLSFSYPSPMPEQQTAVFVDGRTLVMGSEQYLDTFLKTQAGEVDAMPANNVALQQLRRSTAPLRGVLIDPDAALLMGNEQIAQVVDRASFSVAPTAEAVGLRVKVLTKADDQARALMDLLQVGLLMQAGRMKQRMVNRTGQTLEEVSRRPDMMFLDNMTQATRFKRTGKEIAVALDLPLTQLLSLQIPGL
jgi:hypothetical protein